MPDGKVSGRASGSGTDDGFQLKGTLRISSATNSYELTISVEDYGDPDLKIGKDEISGLARGCQLHAG